MSQPPPASTDRMPSTSAKNARTFSAAGENTTACIPVITARAYLLRAGLPKDAACRPARNRGWSQLVWASAQLQQSGAGWPEAAGAVVERSQVIFEIHVQVLAARCLGAAPGVVD